MKMKMLSAYKNRGEQENVTNLHRCLRLACGWRELQKSIMLFCDSCQGYHSIMRWSRTGGKGNNCIVLCPIIYTVKILGNCDIQVIVPLWQTLEKVGLTT